MKVTLYNDAGGSFEVDDTPQRREWARGKGYYLDKPPKAIPEPKPPAEGD